MKRKQGFPSLPTPLVELLAIRLGDKAAKSLVAPQAGEGSRVSSACHTLLLERYSGTWVRKVLQYTASRMRNAARKTSGGILNASIKTSAGANNNWIGRS